MTRRPTATVQHELGVRLVVPGDASIALPVTLRYNTSDPYAVHALFQTGLGDGVTWVFARETLAAGIQGPTGDGDVRVWPAKSKSDRALRRGRGEGRVVYIALSSPDGQALLEAPIDGLTTFLLQTYALVARDEETSYLDIDGGLAAMLGQAS
jgi:hypothetical protein